MSGRIARNGRARLASVVCWAVLFPGALGCERGDHDQATPAFMPSWTEARQALESSLSAWRDSPSPISTSPDIAGVQFVDRTRKPNQRLLSFQILGQTDIEYVRQFTVRLNLEGGESPQLVKYNVLGRAPVWVFRLEDYEMIAHWEHNMNTTAAEPTDNPRPAEPPAKTR